MTGAARRVIWELYRPGGGSFAGPADDPSGYTFEGYAALKAAQDHIEAGSVITLWLPDTDGGDP